MQYSRWAGRAARGMVAALLVGLVACGPEAGGTPATAGTPGGARFHVTVTTTQIRALTQAVSGDRATVTAILTANDDPHSYEPKPQDVQAIATAGLVLKHGLGLDKWLDKVIQNAGSRTAPVVVTAGIPVEGGSAAEPAGDPHVWFDVSNAMTMTRNIRDALAAADPADAPVYAANTAAYLAQLRALDGQIRDAIATIPTAQRKLVTNHDAFGYYIRRYGLTFVGSVIPGMDSSAEPSAKELAGLVQQIRAEHVRAIFLETSINPKLEQQIAREASVQVVDTLYGDTLGPPGSAAYTYEGMMQYDTDTIVHALK